MGIAHKLTVGYLLSVLIVGGVSWYALGRFQASVQGEIGARALVVAESTVDHMDEYIAARLEDLLAYALCCEIVADAVASGREFDALEARDAYVATVDTAWRSGSDTPAIRAALGSHLAGQFRRRLAYFAEHYGYPLYSELYITNKYGVVVAASGRTSDYLQADEAWYRRAVAAPRF